MSGSGTTAVHGGATGDTVRGPVGSPILRPSPLAFDTTRALLTARDTPAGGTGGSALLAFRCAAGVADDLVRLSIGLEDVEDLWADVDHALR